MEELVVLVDQENNEIGTAPKASVHTKNTPLHRGFSLYLFNSKKQILITRRALSKKTFPGVWTNTVCGHPGPGESVLKAAKRRLKDELGLCVEEVRFVAPYRYRFADRNGIVENEICPVLIAYSDDNPRSDKSEVEEWGWVGWDEFIKDIKKHPVKYSPWSIEEVKLIKNI